MYAIVPLIRKSAKVPIELNYSGAMRFRRHESGRCSQSHLIQLVLQQDKCEYIVHNR